MFKVWRRWPRGLARIAVRQNPAHTQKGGQVDRQSVCPVPLCTAPRQALTPPCPARPSFRQRRAAAAAITLVLATSSAVVMGGAVPAYARMDLPRPQFSSDAEGFGSTAPFSCHPEPRPGTRQFAELLKAASGYSYSAERACNASHGVVNSYHKSGRAVDLFIDFEENPQKADGQRLLNWLFEDDAERLRRLGIVEVIWGGRIWTTARDRDQPTPVHNSWRSYTALGCAGPSDTANDTACHFDHFHFTLSAAGSEGRTTWWKSSSPPDTDDDGVPDASDSCPESAGLVGRRGCPPASAVVPTDANGDGKSDVLWLDSEDGQWRVSYAGASSWKTLNASDVRAQNVHVGDFDGDRRSDVLWAAALDGQWRVSSGGTSPWKVINKSNVAFEQLLVGDFDGDRRSDVLWTAAPDGQWRVSSGGTSPWKVINKSNVAYQQLLVG